MEYSENNLSENNEDCIFIWLMLQNSFLSSSISVKKYHQKLNEWLGFKYLCFCNSGPNVFFGSTVNTVYYDQLTN